MRILCLNKQTHTMKPQNVCTQSVSMFNTQKGRAAAFSTGLSLSVCTQNYWTCLQSSVMHVHTRYKVAYVQTYIYI